jgi:hypothetical protein
MHDFTPAPIRDGSHWLFSDGTRLPVIAGGDGPVEEPPPEPLTAEQIAAQVENLPNISDPTELDTLSAGIRAAYQAHRNPDDGLVDTGILADIQAALAAVTARQGEVAAEQDAALQELARLDALVEGAEEIEVPAEFADWSDEELAIAAGLDEDGWAALSALAVDPEPTQEPEAEPQVTEPAPARTVLSMPRSPQQPQPSEPEPEVIEARDFATGAPMDGDQVLRALQAEAQAYGPGQAGRKVRVASIPLSPDAPRMEAGEDAQAFYDRQLLAKREWRQSRNHGSVRQASGELCAPPFVDYSVVNYGSDAQPIGGIFPRAAGGTADQMKTLRFFRGITYTDITDVALDTSWGTAGGTHANTVGTGSATATQNALATDNASSPYPKLAMRANCLTAIDCEQRANWLEIVYDNLGSMAWPEFVAAIRRAGDIALANQMDELRLQDWYDAADSAGVLLTPVAQPFSANHNVVKQIVDIVQNDRSDKRDWEAPYVVAAPQWLDGAIVSEELGTVAIASGQEAITAARQQIFRDYGITFVGYLGRFGVTAAANETENGYPTKLPALADGAIPQAPCEARVGIARDDAGFERIGDTLNLGVLRTETDLENNDWRTFYETWNRLCFRDAPIVADITVNPSAAVAGAISSPVDLCAGSGS